MIRIALIDYGAGNVRSASRALARAADLVDRNSHIEVTADPDLILKADHIVLPGVGHFADCMSALTAKEGVVEALHEAVKRRGTPFFGICVGMQLLAGLGLEDGETDGLGWIPGVVDKLEPWDSELAVPHMGWNEIYLRDHPVLSDLGDEPHVYFTHSYVMSCEDESHISATFDYGGNYVAAVARDTIFGSQFHPEKSQKTGQKILSNFLEWRP